MVLSRANILLCRSFKKAFTAKRAEGKNLGSIVAKSSGLIVRSAPWVITNWSAERLFAARAEVIDLSRFGRSFDNNG
jgi:hypothetical protein